ncbi:nucleotide sugar dehydrogenase [Fulvivirgaceae bacterium BMA12]|uniref:UDP-glucose 6-dehydrogenase n=1 Tax=Agaribacillus aureus TaxID=3051825 RepID=A0ABT8L345_9BACT|nr:nucleotide sugar dehydrogenase [Fulvivirgaceae bacterium BMA12]
MITVIGLGFVGLTTALGFSKKGFKVYGIDIDENKLAKLKAHEVPFYEPHLDVVLAEQLGVNFILDADFNDAINDSQAVFVCVGTPSQPDGSADLTYLLKAIEGVLAVGNKNFQTIIVKSTVPPSTISRQVVPFVKEKSAADQQVGLASNPEFLREGYSWEDFIEPDRVVIGVEDERSKEILNRIYSPFNAPIHYVTFNTAEFIKYLSNTLLSTMISYSNEMSMVADHIGNIDIPSAFKILHEDKRWAGNPASMSGYVYPGCGYGGYCLPKDTSALDSIAEAHGYKTKMLSANLEVNEDIKNFLVNKVKSELDTSERIGILGLSFKKGSDDVRLSPTKDIIQRLLDGGFNNLVAYDPLANKTFAEEYNFPIEYAGSLNELVDQSGALLLLTAWDEFKDNADLIKQKKLFDFRYAL